MNHLTVKPDVEVNWYKSMILKTFVNLFRRETNINASFHLTAGREMSQRYATTEVLLALCGILCAYSCKSTDLQPSTA